MTNPTNGFSDSNDPNDPTSFNYGKSQAEIDAAKAAQSSGVSQVTPIFKDFWGKFENERWYFPGQEDLPEEYKQYIEFKGMDEGARSRYQKATNKGVVIERSTNNARMGVDPAGDRKALFEASVQDWRLAQNGNLIPFKMHTFRQWAETANPKLIDELETAIRKANPWMVNEMSSQAIRDEINSLEEQYKEAKAREEADADFGSKRETS